jgi:hypothetical protein
VSARKASVVTPIAKANVAKSSAHATATVVPKVHAREIADRKARAAKGTDHVPRARAKVIVALRDHAPMARVLMVLVRKAHVLESTISSA